MPSCQCSLQVDLDSPSSDPSFLPPPPGLLARSSRTASLASIATGLHSSLPSTDSMSFSWPGSSPIAGSSRTSSPSPASLLLGHPSPPLPPVHNLSFSSLANSSNLHANTSNTDNNKGFVVTSRPKPYFPPTSTSNSPHLSPSAHCVPLPSPLPLPSSSSSPPASSYSPSPVSSSPVLFSPPHADKSLLFHHTSTSSSSSALRSRRNSPPPPLTQSTISTSSHSQQSSVAGPSEPKTTLTLSSSIDSKGRRMVNQYVRLKTIGQGSHGKVWLCAEPTSLGNLDEDGEADEVHSDEEVTEAGVTRKVSERQRSKMRGTADPPWEDDRGDVEYCAIKSVARDGPGRGKSLRAAKGRKATTDCISGGIGADDKVKREVAIMKRLDHRNVVRLKEVIDDVKSKKVFMGPYSLSSLLTHL